MKAFFYSLSVFLLFSTLAAFAALNSEAGLQALRAQSAEAAHLKVNSEFDSRERIVRESFSRNLGVSAGEGFFELSPEYPLDESFLSDLNYSQVNCSVNGSRLDFNSSSFYFESGSAWEIELEFEGDLPSASWDYLDSGPGGKQFSLTVSNGSHESTESAVVAGASRLFVEKGGVIAQVDVWPGLNAVFYGSAKARFKVLNDETIIECNEVSSWFGEKGKSAPARIS